MVTTERAKKIITLLTLVMIVILMGTTNGFACRSNSASSKERGQIYYTGTIKFNPSHKTKKCGYGIANGKHIKKATHKYTRNGKIITAGTAGPAKNRKNKSYINKISCFDDIRWGKKYTTRYNYDWKYF